MLTFSNQILRTLITNPGATKTELAKILFVGGREDISELELEESITELIQQQFIHRTLGQGADFLNNPRYFCSLRLRSNKALPIQNSSLEAEAQFSSNGGVQVLEKEDLLKDVDIRLICLMAFLQDRPEGVFLKYLKICLSEALGSSTAVSNMVAEAFKLGWVQRSKQGTQTLIVSTAPEMLKAKEKFMSEQQSGEIILELALDTLLALELEDLKECPDSAVNLFELEKEVFVTPILKMPEPLYFAGIAWRQALVINQKVYAVISEWRYNLQTQQLEEFMFSIPEMCNAEVYAAIERMSKEMLLSNIFDLYYNRQNYEGLRVSVK